VERDLRELGRIKIDEKRQLVISECSQKIVISEYIDTQSYEGFTSHVVAISKDNIELFINETNRVLHKELQINILKWGTSKKHDLIIKKVEKEKDNFTADKYDFRLYVNGDNYKGYTKKGLRLTRSITKQLIIFLEKYNKIVKSHGCSAV